MMTSLSGCEYQPSLRSETFIVVSAGKGSLLMASQQGIILFIFRTVSFQFCFKNVGVTGNGIQKPSKSLVRFAQVAIQRAEIWSPRYTCLIIYFRRWDDQTVSHKLSPNSCPCTLVPRVSPRQDWNLGQEHEARYKVCLSTWIIPLRCSRRSGGHTYLRESPAGKVIACMACVMPS